MSRLVELTKNLQYVMREDGPYAVVDRLGVHAKQVAGRVKNKFIQHDASNDFVDVMFINGCSRLLPHPIRYRVDHQAEQLEAAGVSTRIIDAWNWNDECARLARTFVIFRCPYSDFIGHMIDTIHFLNKKVYFDIDDLVFDTSYTDLIPYVQAMPPVDREGYDDGVRKMGQTLMLCDGAITTTEQLATELRKYVDVVFVNHNTASEEMHRFSEKAIYERDILPKLPSSQVKASDRHRWKIARERSASKKDFALGYFSGSITHNDDFEMILPAIVKFMENYSNVTLHIVGELDLPEELVPYSNRVIRLPFSPWRHLPKMISQVDINLIPLRNTVFNRAKSENKWVEAALVKVPSLASRTGALADAVIDGENILLCDDDSDAWYDALIKMKDDSTLRRSIAEKAYRECVDHHLTFGSGADLARFFQEHRTPNIGIVLPGFDISGGVLVAFKHAAFLKHAGFDVTVLGLLHEFEDQKWVDFEGERFPALLMPKAHMRGRFDKMVATMWTTLSPIKYYENCRDRYYLVQNKETGFYKAGDSNRFDASITYGINPNVTYCTISPWCKSWLENEFGKTVRYARNGIDSEMFYPEERDWSGRIRILVEGDSESHYKNVDESFAIIEKLDKRKFEIWYMSYNGKPKSSYRVDKFLHAVPHDKVGDVYRSCHILLKTSILESFSYPPLEMMATGGQVVVLRNEGNAAYLVDNENALLFDQGEDDKAVKQIKRLVEDADLRGRLLSNGLETARSLDWANLKDEILDLYK